MHFYASIVHLSVLLMMEYFVFMQLLSNLWSQPQCSDICKRMLIPLLNPLAMAAGAI